MAVELLCLSAERGVINEVDLADLLDREEGRLLFNGLHVCVVVGEAVDSAKALFAAPLLAPAGMPLGFRIDVAVYHPEEEAIYVGVSCRVKCSEEVIETRGRIIRKGKEEGSVSVSAISYDTAAGILEWMNSIDLKPLAGLGGSWV